MLSTWHENLIWSWSGLGFLPMVLNRCIFMELFRKSNMCCTYILILMFLLAKEKSQSDSLCFPHILPKWHRTCTSIVTCIYEPSNCWLTLQNKDFQNTFFTGHETISRNLILTFLVWWLYPFLCNSIVTEVQWSKYFFTNVCFLAQAWNFTFNRTNCWTPLSSGHRQLWVHIPEEQYPGGLTSRNIADISLSAHLGKSFHHPVLQFLCLLKERYKLLLKAVTKNLLFCRRLACQDQSFTYQSTKHFSDDHICTVCYIEICKIRKQMRITAFFFYPEGGKNNLFLRSERKSKANQQEWL